MNNFLHCSRSVASVSENLPFFETPGADEPSTAWTAVFMEAKPLRDSDDKDMDSNVPQAVAQAFAG